jgi:hypothetical protein
MGKDPFFASLPHQQWSTVVEGMERLDLSGPRNRLPPVVTSHLGQCIERANASQSVNHVLLARSIFLEAELFCNWFISPSFIVYALRLCKFADHGQVSIQGGDIFEVPQNPFLDRPRCLDSLVSYAG